METRYKRQSFAQALTLPNAQDTQLSLDNILAEGSKSFNAASKLLPTRTRRPVKVLYAFCRIADDAVDDAEDAKSALEALYHRLDNIYEGRLSLDPLDRAFYETVTKYGIPKSIISAMFEGFEWDVNGKPCQTINDTLDYCARVASTVGVMMSLIMGQRDPQVLARACDLGLAMQLVNICRDVGEDADMGRVYLPTDWLAQVGIDRHDFVLNPTFSPALGEVVERTLKLAYHHFELADIGISCLPRDCRVAVKAASLIYSDIGRIIKKNNFDSVSTRAYTKTLRKLWLCIKATKSIFKKRMPNEYPSHSSVQFLVDAAVSHDTATNLILEKI